MPIYEYRCEACGAELEKLQKISDPLLVECPACGKNKLVKQVSASSFRLKGSGWYETDFKTGKKKNGAGESPSDASAAAGSGGDSSSDTSSNKESKDGVGKGSGKGNEHGSEKKGTEKAQTSTSGGSESGASNKPSSSGNSAAT